MNRPLPPAFAPRRIVLFRALFLGDLLCATPTFRALQRRFPGAEITLVGLPWARELADRLPSLDRFEAFPGHQGLPDQTADPAQTAAFLARMRNTRYDLAVQLHGDGCVSNEIVAAFGARRTLGFGSPDDPRLDVALPWREEEHEVRRWLRLAAALGAPIDDTAIDLPLTSADRRQARLLLAALPAGRGPVVALHAGSKLPSRRWPADRFAALGDALAGRFGARIVLTGGAPEQDLALAIRKRMRVPPLDLTGRTDLGAFAAVVARLDLLVTNDTGASHIAAAARTRSVVLFGPSRPARWAPIDASFHLAIDATLLPGDDHDPESALARLPVRTVLAACESILRGPVIPVPDTQPEAVWHA